MSTFVVSDLHGNFELFLEGLKKIEFSRDDKLYVLGDAIDKGPESICLLQYIMKADNIDMVLGNHEFMMLNSIELSGGVEECRGRDAQLWLYYNGGAKTYDQYKVLQKPERIALVEWLLSRKLSLPLSIRNDKCADNINVILTHSCYNPAYLDRPYADIPYGEAWKIVWKSIFREGRTYCDISIYERFENMVFITGHVPLQRIREEMEDELDEEEQDHNTDDALNPLRVGNLVNIDGGLAYGNYLDNNGAIFLRLEDFKSTVVLLNGREV